MNKQIENMLKKLKLCEEAKNSLRVAGRLLNFNSKAVHNNAFVPLAIAEEGRFPKSLE